MNLTPLLRIIAPAALALCVLPLAAQQTEEQKLLASDGASSDSFGLSVAVSGNTAVVGAPWDDDQGAQSGSAYFFERTGGVWSAQQKVLPSDGGPNEAFGYMVSVSGDTAVIGAPYHASHGQTGSAYVFVRIGGTWLEQQELVPSDGAAGDVFGFSVSVSGDTAVVGAYLHDARGLNSGSAYVFARTGSVWTEQQKLVAIDGSKDDAFGWSVAVSGDTAVIGAVNDDDNGGESGSAYVFVRSGAVWTEQQKLLPMDGNTQDSFGTSVSVSGDTAVVGANQWRSATGSGGRAYVFVRAGGIWQEWQKLLASDGVVGDRFGTSVSVSGDLAIIGAEFADPAGQASGSAYVFASTAGVWTEQQKLLPSDGAANDRFGASVCVAGDRAIVSAYLDDDLGADSGSAYTFDAGEPASTAPRDVALFDADGDGDFDAATANSGSDNVSLWSNDGTGTLTESSVALDPADLTPVAVATGDLDDDGGADDLVVACAGSHTVGRVTNVGSTPLAASTSSGGLRPTDVACGDLDAADGRDDVVVAREGEFLSGGAGIAVSLNGGPFTDLAIPAGNATKAVKLALGDLDGDGDQDLAAVAQGSPDQVLLFDGDGQGGLTFAGALDLPTSGLANGLCCADLDGDGNGDLAVGLTVLFPTPATSLRIYTYTGSGSLDAADYDGGVDVATGGTLAVDVACGELDGDTMPGYLWRRDVVVVHAGSGDAEALYGYDPNAAGFGSSAALSVGQNPVAAAIGDLNGDCVDDVVIANQGSNDVTVNLGNPGALAQAFGSGCPGTGGLVPALTGIGLPTLGNPSFGVHLDNARAFAPVLVMFAADQAALALPGGCELYLASPIITVQAFTDGNGEHSFVFSVPNIPALLCTNLFLQDLVFDTSGSFASIVALSNAVRVHVGG